MDLHTAVQRISANALPAKCLGRGRTELDRNALKLRLWQRQCLDLKEAVKPVAATGWVNDKKEMLTFSSQGVAYPCLFRYRSPNHKSP